MSLHTPVGFAPRVFAVILAALLRAHLHTCALVTPYVEIVKLVSVFITSLFPRPHYVQISSSEIILTLPQRVTFRQVTEHLV